MLGVGVNLTLTLFDLKEFGVLNSALGGSNVSLSRVLKMFKDPNTFGSCNLRFRAQFLESPPKYD